MGVDFGCYSTSLPADYEFARLVRKGVSSLGMCFAKLRDLPMYDQNNTKARRTV